MYFSINYQFNDFGVLFSFNVFILNTSSILGATKTHTNTLSLLVPDNCKHMGECGPVCSLQPSMDLFHEDQAVGEINPRGLIVSESV